MRQKVYRLFADVDLWLESKRLKVRGKAIGYESLLPPVLGLVAVAVWFGVADLDARRVCQEATRPHLCRSFIGAHIFYFTGLPWLLIVMYSAAKRKARRMENASRKTR